jgi:hypothetical protein
MVRCERIEFFIRKEALKGEIGKDEVMMKNGSVDQAKFELTDIAGEADGHHDMVGRTGPRYWGFVPSSQPVLPRR